MNPQLRQDLVNYLKEKLKNKSKPKITVIAPYELSEVEIAQLKRKIPLLSETELILKVNPEIMAGIIIRYGSQMIDLSLQSEIKKLEHTLYETA